MFNRSKKGDLPIVLLVIMTFVLCIISLIYFYISGTRSTDTLSDASRVVNTYSEYELFEQEAFLTSKSIAIELYKNNNLNLDSFKEEFLKDFKYQSKDYIFSLKDSVFEVSVDSAKKISIKISNVKYIAYKRDSNYDIDYIVFVKNLEFMF